MARPLRIERAGAWYHVTGRGTERRRIFTDERDRRHWLELLGEAAEMWRWVIYGYVLMENHHHVMLETREANLGRGMQWLNTSYAMWFNRRHQRVGALFQGRYKAILVDRLGWGLELSRYLHLNPVRIATFGLDKKARQAQRLGVGGLPDARQVRERILRLGRYEWSSYRAYVGRVEGPEWLEKKTILKLGGGGGVKERQREYRRYVESAVREGMEASPWEQLRGQLVLGTQQMWEQVRRRVGGPKREQPQARGFGRRLEFAEIVRAVEEFKGEAWGVFRDRHGDWGRDLALYWGRRHGGMRLARLGQEVGGVDYAAVSTAIKRMEKRLQEDKRLNELARRAESKLLKVET